MSGDFDVWKLIGGIGLFLFAMAQLETALRAFTGRRFKLFLRNYTDSPLKAVVGGAATTAFLQSSSLVGLMVLAFVGAGMMSLQNALGVIFGANLGTTVTGWIVTAVGFKLDIDALALPLIGFGGIAVVGAAGRLANFGRIVIAIGFLLMGLGFMKGSVASLGDSFDIAHLAGYPAWQYLLFGVVFAAVVQSSSAAMMVTLATLHAGLINLPSAAAIAIGAGLGTTSTILFGAIKGVPAKKRVALAHFVFTVVTGIIAFVLRIPLLALIAGAGITDPLYALVAFHSLFNFMGIVLFLPVTDALARFLEQQFVEKRQPAARFVSQLSPTVSDAALTAITDETGYLISRVTFQNMNAFTPALETPEGRVPVAITRPEQHAEEAFVDQYHKTKVLEGEILSFAIKVQSEPMDVDESARLNQLLSAVRQATHSAKSIRDIRHDLAEFEESPRATVSAYVGYFRTATSEFFDQLFNLRRKDDDEVSFADLVELLAQVRESHDRLHKTIYSDVSDGKLAETEISSLLNVNRALLNSNVALIMALNDYHLDVSQAEALEQLPGIV
jgi:phosphate:Na+ symporter